MKAIVMRCNQCGKIKVVDGNTTDEVIRKIDASGWKDEPDHTYKQGIKFTCPDCQKKG